MGEPDGKIPLDYRDQRPEQEERKRRRRGAITDAAMQGIVELGIGALAIFGIPYIVLFVMKSCSKHP